MSNKLVNRPVKSIVQPSDRVGAIKSALDELERVQNQYAAGCVLIGMELLALKHQLGHGEFLVTFKEEIERPRFSYKTGQRFMRVAEQIRMKLAAGASIKLGEVLSMAMAPSAMDEKERRELLAKVGDACQGKTMQQLMLDFACGPKQIAAPALSDEEKVKHDAAWNNKHYTEAWDSTLETLAKLSNKKTWAYLHDEKIKQIRHCLSSILGLMPVKK